MPAFDVRNDPYCRLKDTACTLDISACFRWFQFNTHLTHFTFFFRIDNSDSSFSFIYDATFHFTELLPLLPLFPSFRITSDFSPEPHEASKLSRSSSHAYFFGTPRTPTSVDWIMHQRAGILHTPDLFFFDFVVFQSLPGFNFNRNTCTFVSSLVPDFHCTSINTHCCLLSSANLHQFRLN